MVASVTLPGPADVGSLGGGKTGRRRPRRPDSSAILRESEVRARRSGELALTEEEVKTLLASVKDLRDAAILRLAIETGMRRDDLANVKVQDLDLDAGTVVFYEHKKRRTWRSWFGQETARYVAMWLDHRGSGPWLFPSPWDRHGHMSDRALYDVLQRALKQAGLKPRPFHALRATCIKLARRRGWSMEEVMMQTGDSYRTIKLHYETPSRDEMAAAIRQRPVLGGPSG